MIRKKIDAFYGRFMNRTGMTATEVRKAASDFDIKAFADKAKYYVEHKDFSPMANAELMLYNFKMRYNQLELLQANLDLTMIAVGNDEESWLKKEKIKQLERTYKENAGILGLSAPSPERMKQVVESAVNKPWLVA